MNSSITHINIGTMRQTRLQSASKELTVADGLEMVSERLKTLCWRLNNDLKAEVFQKETIEMIENCRIVCDIKSLVVKLLNKGSVVVGLEEARTFVDSVRRITGTLRSIKDDHLINDYRVFVECMEKLFLTNFDVKTIHKKSSKELIAAILREPTTFQTSRVIVHCICVASVKISVESVVESLVSKYEKHFDSSRQPTEEHAVDEMIILENGPLLHQADNVIEKAMSKYWKNGEWHFIRKHENVRSYTGGSSKVIGKLLEQKSKLPFM